MCSAHSSAVAAAANAVRLQYGRFCPQGAAAPPPPLPGPGGGGGGGGGYGHNQMGEQSGWMPSHNDKTKNRTDRGGTQRWGRARVRPLVLMLQCGAVAVLRACVGGGGGGGRGGHGSQGPHQGGRQGRGGGGGGGRHQQNSHYGDHGNRGGNHRGDSYGAVGGGNGGRSGGGGGGGGGSGGMRDDSYSRDSYDKVHDDGGEINDGRSKQVTAGSGCCCRTVYMSSALRAYGRCCCCC